MNGWSSLEILRCCRDSLEFAQLRPGPSCRFGPTSSHEDEQPKITELGLGVKDVPGMYPQWWTGWGSNPRPPHCERGALPTELPAHTQA